MEKVASTSMAGRLLRDRLMRVVAPKPRRDYAPPLQPFAPDVWILDRQLRLPGGPRLPSRTTVLRLRDGALVVVSPPPLFDGGRIAAIDALGSVRYVVAPNSFHYLYAPAFLALYPDAELLACPGLRERVPGFPRAKTLGADTPAAWSGEIEIAILGPVDGLCEVTFFHVPSGVLVLTDIGFNMVRFERVFDRLAWRASGVPRGFGPSRTARLLLLQDRSEAQRCLRQIARWPIGKIIVGHGDAIETKAAERFAKAYADYLGPDP